MSIVTTSTDLGGLAARIEGTVAGPEDPGYTLASPFNVAVPVKPLAVVAVATAQDVAETVRYAGERGLRVVAQRTGHGAVAVGDDTLLIHTAGLDELRIDPATRTARVGAGVIWAQVMEAALAHGLAPVIGSTSGVGVAGFLTGGGIGPTVRTHGLASDRLRAAEVVTGDGRLLRATAMEEPELFRALKGGKSTAGLVCAVEVELLEIDTLHGGALFFGTDDVAAVLHAWRAWAPSLPEHANTSVAILQLPPLPNVPPPLAGRMTVAVRFASTASDEESAALLAPMRAVATPVIDTVARMPYAASDAIHMDPTDPLPATEAAGLLRELPPEAVDALLAVAGPSSGSPQVVVELRLLGGALARRPEHADVFCHRDAAYSVLAIGALMPQIAGIVGPHGESVVAALGPWATGGAMPNFCSLSDGGRVARAYDGDTRAWLAALAARHDPAGVLGGQVVR